MSDDLSTDDSSHYEISLTAGQAFIAFVLLLFSLAASFAFGLIIGRGQEDDRLVVRREPAVISEGVAVEDSRIVELDEVPPPTATVAQDEVPILIEEGLADLPPQPVEQPSAGEADPTPTVPAPQPEPQSPPQKAPEPAPSGPVFAQVLSSTDARAAENLAARLIDSGFNTAYVERVSGASGMIYRVRVRFASEQEARAAIDRLRAITRSDPWITRQ